MTYKYKLIKDPFTDKTDAVKRYEDGSNFQKLIPFATGNRDYQEYLKWVDAGNTAEAAD